MDMDGAFFLAQLVAHVSPGRPDPRSSRRRQFVWHLGSRQRTIRRDGTLGNDTVAWHALGWFPSHFVTETLVTSFDSPKMDPFLEPKSTIFSKSQLMV